MEDREEFDALLSERRGEGGRANFLMRGEGGRSNLLCGIGMGEVGDSAGKEEEVEEEEGMGSLEADTGVGCRSGGNREMRRRRRRRRGRKRGIITGQGTGSCSLLLNLAPERKTYHIQSPQHRTWGLWCGAEQVFQECRTGIPAPFCMVPIA